MYYTITYTVYNVLHNNSFCLQCITQCFTLSTMYYTIIHIVYNVIHNNSYCLQCINNNSYCLQCTTQLACRLIWFRVRPDWRSALVHMYTRPPTRPYSSPDNYSCQQGRTRTSWTISTIIVHPMCEEEEI